jgi:hypothetical protein
VVPTTVSIAPTPTHEATCISNTPAQGGVVPTAASVTPTIQGKMTHASIEEDSGKSTTDLGPIREGCFIFIFIFCSIYF